MVPFRLAIRRGIPRCISSDISQYDHLKRGSRCQYGANGGIKKKAIVERAPVRGIGSGSMAANQLQSANGAEVTGRILRLGVGEEKVITTDIDSSTNNKNRTIHIVHLPSWPLTSQSQHQLLQFLEIRRPKSSNRIPAFSSIPMCTRNNQATRHGPIALRINTTTSIRSTGRNIVQRLESLRVQERIQETKNGLANAQTGIIEETDYASECRCRGGCST